MVGNICRQLLRISCRACSLSIKIFPFCGAVARLPCARLRVKIFKAVNAAPTVFSVLERLPIACGSRSFFMFNFFRVFSSFRRSQRSFFCVQFCAFSRCSLVVRSTCAAALPVVSKCALAGSFLCSHFLALSVFSRRSFGVHSGFKLCSLPRLA